MSIQTIVVGKMRQRHTRVDDIGSLFTRTTKLHSLGKYVFWSKSSQKRSISIVK